jgi:transposase
MHSKEAPRRRHSLEFKERVLAACAEPGASVAAVARLFELNDNLVHQWRRGRGVGTAKPAAPIAQRAPEFVELSLPAPSTPKAVIAVPSESIRIELKRGSLSVNVLWPLSAAGDCTAWLRELLR